MTEPMGSDSILRQVMGMMENATRHTAEQEVLQRKQTAAMLSELESSARVTQANIAVAAAEIAVHEAEYLSDQPLTDERKKFLGAKTAALRVLVRAYEAQEASLLDLYKTRLEGAQSTLSGASMAELMNELNGQLRDRLGELG